MKKKSFFLRTKNILAARKIFTAIGLSILVIICFIYTSMIGFSTDIHWAIKLGSRNSPIGIPIPNFLISLIFIGLGIWLISNVISLIRTIINDEEFQLFLNALNHNFGNLDVIDENLLNTDKCRYAKYELRCNKTYTYYRKGDDIEFIETSSIISIQPAVNGKDYYVLLLNQNKEDTFRVYTTKKNIAKLQEFINARKQA